MIEEISLNVKEYKDLCDSANDLMQSVTPDRRFRYVNNAWHQVLGYSKREATGMTVWDIIHPDELEHFQEIFMRVMSGEDVGLVTTTFVTRDGRKVFVEGNINCHFADGKPVYTRAIFRDITKRKQTEEEFEKIFNLSPDMVGIFTTEGELVKVNHSWETILGYKTEELLKMGWANLVHPDDVERTNKEVEEQLKGSPVVNFINRYKCKDGSYKTLEWQATFAKGGIVYATARDITERKRAEEEIGKFKTITEKANYGIAMIDAETNNIVYTNKTFAHMHGYADDQLIGCHYSVLFTEEQLKEAEKLKEEALTETDFGTKELWRKRHDGSVFPTITRSIVVKDEDGKPLFIAATAIDITERKQAEEALRESEGRYRAILELSGEVGEAVLMLQDTDDKKGVHAFATGEWSRITGYSMEELLGMSWFDLLHPGYREASLERFQRRMGGEIIPGLLEVSIVRKDGTEVPVEITAGPTTYRGKFALVVYARDITGPKKAEQEREKLIQELTKTLQEVKTLSGLLPICAWCKKFRDDEGYWKSVEEYLGERTGAEFTHGICPECAAKFLDHS
ncbi:MAG: PAS domain S-box protein [Chloroflexi bacterium]|nr:PAS domain S-box protein [Chloroflexota bacterium]